jgi:CO/xanthine dehydrogenase FAD-binding subunit
VVMRFLDIESSLAGRTLGMEVLSEVGRRSAERIQPIDDIRASASYRKMVAEGLPLKILEG